MLSRYPIIKFTAYSVLFLAWMCLGTFSYWLLFDRDTPVISRVNKVSTTEVRPNDPITVVYESTRLRSCFIKFNRIIETEDGSYSQIISSGVGNITDKELGKAALVDVIFTVPPNISPGEYKFIIRLTYVCNPAQNLFPIYMESEVVRFKVI